jgi:hypothetical protein
MVGLVLVKMGFLKDKMMTISAPFGFQLRPGFLVSIRMMEVVLAVVTLLPRFRYGSELRECQALVAHIFRRMGLIGMR